MVLNVDLRIFLLKQATIVLNPHSQRYYCRFCWFSLVAFFFLLSLYNIMCSIFGSGFFHLPISYLHSICLVFSLSLSFPFFFQIYDDAFHQQCANNVHISQTKRKENVNWSAHEETYKPNRTERMSAKKRERDKYSAIHREECNTIGFFVSLCHDVLC